jgi:hypothetical protein
MTRRNSRKRWIEDETLAKWADDDPGFSPAFIAQRERESRRTVNTAMKFWAACPQPKCRRHRRCAHDPGFCGPMFWPVVPEPLKAAWRALHDAKAAGRTCTRAFREADAAQAFEQRKQASYAAVPPARSV